MTIPYYTAEIGGKFYPLKFTINNALDFEKFGGNLFEINAVLINKLSLFLKNLSGNSAEFLNELAKEPYSAGKIAIEVLKCGGYISEKQKCEAVKYRAGFDRKTGEVFPIKVEEKELEFKSFSEFFYSDFWGLWAKYFPPKDIFDLTFGEAETLIKSRQIGINEQSYLASVLNREAYHAKIFRDYNKIFPKVLSEKEKAEKMKAIILSKFA